MKEFSQLKKNLKKDFTQLKKIRVAVLGDSATQFLSQAIRATGYDYGFNIEIWEAGFNQIDRQIIDPASELYLFRPEAVLLFQSSHKLLGKFNRLTVEQQTQLANEEINRIKTFNTLIVERTKAKLIVYNYNEIDDSAFGNFANKAEQSFLFQLRKLNYQLMELATRYPNFFICDLSSLQNQMGRACFFHPSIYVNTEMVLGTEALPYVAARTVDIIAAFQGKLRKCMILDLDNTIWGGMIGDDGIENIQIGNLGIGKAFSEFQYWIKALKNRGVIIAVCSKNTEAIAKEPFEKHPDMVLRLEDISVFVANWKNKADNIRTIQQILNIGFDSMVFLDDNPFERNMVLENIPEICVPELPEDPAEYLEFLYSLNLFETVSVSGEDAERTKLYQTEAQRMVLLQSFTNEDDFLKSLNMTATVEGFTKFNIPRVAQLTQRSNQFNLRTVRYTEADIETIANSGEYFPFAFSLEDKFGRHGLISIVILKKELENTLFIDSWLMSCRVLKRGMEQLVLNTLVAFAQENGFSKLKGEYIATAKNGLVRNHYRDLGFEETGAYWQLDITKYLPTPTFIKTKK